VLLAVSLTVSLLLGAVTTEERQTAQNMINRGNNLRETYEKERAEFIEAGIKWLEDPTEENRTEALEELGERRAAEDALKKNRDSTIAYVDSVFGIDQPPGTDIQYDPECTDYGYTSSRCFVRICEPGFESPDILASTKIHEYEHVRQKQAGRWGPGNVPQDCTFRFHELEFDAYEAEMDADFGGTTSLPIDEKIEILKRKIEHLDKMIDAVAAQFEGSKLERTLPGTPLEKPVTVANDADVPQLVSGYFTNQQDWLVEPGSFEFYLDSEQETTFTLTVHVPPVVELGIGNEVMCHVYSDLFATLSPKAAQLAMMQADSTRAFFFVNVIPAVDVVAGDNVGGEDGDVVDFEFTIVNEGTYPDDFTIQVSSVLGWDVTPVSQDIHLGIGESYDLLGSVEIPDSTPGTTDLIKCVATSLSDPVQTDSSWLYAEVEGPLADLGDGSGRFAFALMPNVPNPFRDGTCLRFSIPSRSPVDLRVYDVRGRLVRTLVDAGAGVLKPGIHNVTWDGTDEQGRRVATGVYFSKLEGCGRTAKSKLVLVR
jgi:hypothetical protein